MDNSSLVVLEYTKPDTTLQVEQSWINRLSNKYNVLFNVSNTLEYKHRQESIEKSEKQ